MGSRQCLIKCSCDLRMSIRARIDRRRNPIGLKCLEPPEVPPILQDWWVSRKARQICLVVTFEKNCTKCPVARHQSINYLSRSRPTIDVVAKINFNADGTRICYEIRVDPCEQLV